MAFVITEACTNCGLCEDICPMNAISEGFGRREISGDQCVMCGNCFLFCAEKAIKDEDS